MVLTDEEIKYANRTHSNSIANKIEEENIEEKIEKTTSSSKSSFSYDVAKNTNNTVKTILDINALEYKIQIKAKSLFSQLEEEVILEGYTYTFDEYRRKRGKSNGFPYKPYEMKTNTALNAEEDIFEIFGTKQQIMTKLNCFNEGDPVIITIRRKKLKGIFRCIDEEFVVLDTIDRGVIKFSYKEIDDDKIKFELEV